MRCILVTGATGKVVRHLIESLLQQPDHGDTVIRALCHNRLFPAQDRLEVVRGTLSNADDVAEAMADVTHVVHLATCKETPAHIMDVAVKGLFWLLETCRTSPTFKQFILIGGDAAMGHFFYAHPVPVVETQKHSAYPGCYALSKVLEEVMLEQYQIQYGLNGCCLRAPWIMEKDDFRFTLSFGEDVFGGPLWRGLVGDERADVYLREGRVPLMLDASGKPLQRNFVHVSDLVDAIVLALDHPAARQQTFNISMDEPVNYAEVAAYLKETRGLPSVEIPSPYQSTWLDNTKAKFLLGWRPHYDLPKLIDAAFSYKRALDDPRHVWYPG